MACMETCKANGSRLARLTLHGVVIIQICWNIAQVDHHVYDRSFAAPSCQVVLHVDLPLASRLLERTYPFGRYCSEISIISHEKTST